MILQEPDVTNVPEASPARLADAEVLALLGDGQPGPAFERLLERFRDRVFRLACGLLRDESLAEDLTQEIFLRVWKGLPGYQGEASFSTWIYTIARNKRIDRLRRERRPAMSEEEYTTAVGGAEDGGGRGDKAAERSQAEARLARSVDDLPEDQAAVVKMAFYEDKSHSAIAAELKLPLGTVKSRIRLALTRLRGMIQDLDP